jgi:hypothetical protein
VAVKRQEVRAFVLDVDGRFSAPRGRRLVDGVRPDSERIGTDLRSDGIRGLLGSGGEHDVAARGGDGLGGRQAVPLEAPVTIAVAAVRSNEFI